MSPHNKPLFFSRTLDYRDRASPWIAGALQEEHLALQLLFYGIRRPLRLWLGFCFVSIHTLYHVDTTSIHDRCHYGDAFILCPPSTLLACGSATGVSRADTSPSMHKARPYFPSREYCVTQINHSITCLNHLSSEATMSTMYLTDKYYFITSSLHFISSHLNPSPLLVSPPQHAHTRPTTVSAPLITVHQQTLRPSPATKTRQNATRLRVGGVGIYVWRARGGGG